MSSQLNNLGPPRPPSSAPPHYHHIPQHAWKPNSGGSPFARQNTSAHADPFTRIAVLEKELEHSKVEKATAELAVQYLANLGAKAAPCGNGDEQLAKLMSELTRTKEDNLILKAKLENTQSIITSLFTSAPLHYSLTSDQKSQQQSVSVETVDLIDLVDTVNSHGCGKDIQDDTTLLDTSHDDISDLEDAVGSAIKVKLPDRPESIAFPDSGYIHHFTQKKTEILDSAGKAIGLEASIKVSPDLQRCVMESDPSGDQCSETSVEPNSSNSSQYCADSSDAPLSATASFVTANTDKVSENEASTASVQPLDTQASAVQHESSLFDVSSTANSDPCAQPCESKQIMAEGSKEHNFAFAKAALGPTLRKPSWSVNKVFSTEASRERSVHERGMGPAEYRYPELFKYGIRYVPDEEERDIYRTILISNLPADITMHQLLEKVRGGIVVNAKLLDTMKLVGGNSALIVFLHEHAALDYEEHANCHPISFHGSLANVRMVSTPTWPIDPGLRGAIHNHQHTRCLEVRNFPRRQVSESSLRSGLRVCAQMNGDRIEHLELRSDDVLEISFTSIDYAGIAFGMFTTFRSYKNCKTHFVADPCAQPLESLLKEEANVDDPSFFPRNMAEKRSLEPSSDPQA